MSLGTFQAGTQILRAGSWHQGYARHEPQPRGRPVQAELHTAWQVTVAGAHRVAGDDGWFEKQAASNSGEPSALGSGGPEFKSRFWH